MYIKNIFKLILIIIIGLSLSACKYKKPEHRYTQSFIGVFDTATQVIGYAENEKEFSKTISLIKEELNKYHKYYDIYHNYENINNIKTINDNAGKKPVKVDQEIIDLLKFSKDVYYRTNGKVNIAMGSVLKLWHDKREIAINDSKKASLPEFSDLKAASLHTDIEKLIINEKEGTVFLDDKDMLLDVGSVAKGYATEALANFLEKKGYSNLLLSVGGNVRAIGYKLSDDNKKIPWAVGIQNPDLNSDKKSVATLNLVDSSLVTSGIYERFYMFEGKNYHHIINPDTLYPEHDYLSISIVSKSSALADALSTAVFNMSLDEGQNFINSYDGVEAMWILSDSSFVYSKGFEELKK